MAKSKAVRVFSNYKDHSPMHLHAYQVTYRLFIQSIQSNMIKCNPIPCRAVQCSSGQSSPVLRNTFTIRSDPYQSYPILPDQVKTKQPNPNPNARLYPVQFSPVQFSPVQSDEILSYRIPSNPIILSPFHSNPIQPNPSR